MKRDILTLLSANIRRQKGPFISTVILTLIITMAMTAILSIGKNTRDSIRQAMDTAQTPDITVIMADEEKTAVLADKVKSEPSVDRVELQEGILAACKIKGVYGSSSWFLEKYDPDRYPRVKDDMSAYADASPQPKKGEIYVTQGVLSSTSSENCRLGDTILVCPKNAPFEENAIELTIAGIVVEPSMGSAYIGIKQIFISDEDFDALHALETKKSSNCFFARVYQAPDSHLSSPKFQRQINLATGIIDHALISIDRDMAVNATYFLTEIIFSFLTVFLVILMVIVMIVIYHSIVTSIEIDYVNLGVLKAIGFSRSRITQLFFWQYLAALLLGSGLGFLLAIPLIHVFGSVFSPITAIPTPVSLSLGPSLAIMAGIWSLSCLFIWLGTRKLGRITPLRAISGGREAVYFDSRLKAPISRKNLSFSLALRQLTANKMRHVTTAMVAGLLFFFMLTITVLSDSLSSETALESMGQPNLQIHVQIKNRSQLENFDTIAEGMETIICRHTPIRKKLYMNQTYLSLNGENLLCNIYKNPESMIVSKGRAPLYDNEVLITPIVAEALDLQIGDKVILSKEGRTECIITGFFQSMSDTGRTIAINLDCARKLGMPYASYAGYGVEDITVLNTIQQEILSAYDDAVSCEIVEELLPLPEIFDFAILAMKGFIYSLSVIFALVVVVMVCRKTFMQERTDIGIYKALGFSAGELRRQFALRFALIAVLGEVLGAALSLWLSDDILSLLLRSIGITFFKTDYTLLTFALPAVLLCLCFFLFAYWASRRVKAVEVRGLITE